MSNKQTAEEMNCYFIPKQGITPATICENCGREKILHNKLSPVESSNTDKACEVLHGIEFFDQKNAIEAVIKVEALIDVLTALLSELEQLKKEREELREMVKPLTSNNHE